MSKRTLRKSFESLKKDSVEQLTNLSPEEGSLFHSLHTGNKILKHEEPASNICDAYHHDEKTKCNMGSLVNSQLYCHFTPIGYDKYSTLEITDHILAEQEALNHASKKFHLKSSADDLHANWTLPPAAEVFSQDAWQDGELQKMKSELNGVKSILENFDLEVWHSHTHQSNPAFRITQAVRASAKPELLTQAFLKFYEILNAFPILPEDARELHSLHLCEAPGAFIVALNHYLALFRQNTKWKWTGTTFNPYYEGTPSSFCIFDDRLILPTQDHWFFGSDGTGDVTTETYPDELTGAIGRKVNLVTADGSIDCQGDPAEQEGNTHLLHFSEVFLALSLLESGGTLVVKKFTFFESQSVSLLFLVACSFKDVYVYKPITSKLGNSEVYVVGLNFTPTEALVECLNSLRSTYGKRSSKAAMFSRDHLPESFLGSLKRCSAFFMQHQTCAITKNVDLYKTQTDKAVQFNELLKDKVLQLFTSLNPCSPIVFNRRLVQHKLEWDKHVFPSYNSLKWGGHILNLTKVKRLAFLDKRFDMLSQNFSKLHLRRPTDDKGNIETTVKPSQEDLSTYKTTKGKPFFFAYITRFCEANAMQLYVKYFAECITNPDAFYTQSDKVQLELCNEIEWKALWESTLHKLTQIYPADSTVVDSSDFPGPDGGCKPLEDSLDILSSGMVATNSTLVLPGVKLYTRLQCGLFLVLAGLFDNVVFHIHQNFGEIIPFVELKGFKGAEDAKKSVRSLKVVGWEKGGSQAGILDICPVNTIVESALYSSICKYNTYSTLNNIALLISQTKAFRENSLF